MKILEDLFIKIYPRKGLVSEIQGERFTKTIKNFVCRKSTLSIFDNNVYVRCARSESYGLNVITIT